MKPADDTHGLIGPADGTPDAVWGAGSLDQLDAVCESAGARRVMAVAGPSADVIVRRIQPLLGKRYIGRWSDTAAHVPARQASLAVGSARETHADGVLAVGGGSAIGIAKIVALALRIPLIAVPTTFSGSEMTSRYVVTTDQGVEVGASPRSLPRAVVYDPDLLAALPARVAAASGLTAVAHCVEALCYPSVPSGTRDLARQGLLLLWDSLGKVVAGSAEPSFARDALTGASMAGRVHEAAGPGLLHLLCDIAAARQVADYGAALALLLPDMVRAHGDRAAPVSAALAELEPRVPAATALAEFALSLGLAPDHDTPAVRTALAALTTEAGAHPAARPGLASEPAIGRLPGLLAVSAA
ncbi:MAG TPA: iron-containing alcohol dehydrogenase [Trebonia sp.]